ncbi:MAG: glycoside hydrolase family 127 protein [Bacillota bacterium]|nr:glycoside hydrolase family 127 protein [Bacillota bacterium]
MNKKGPKHIQLSEKNLDNDIDRIYLGNLSTVETDIPLPSEGENGTTFIWHSSHEYLLSNTGKVVRPHFGAGNRQATLTLTAINQEITKTKEFTVNILEKEYPFKVISVYPITIYTQVGQLPDLPTVAVVHNDLNEDAVIPVEWENIKKEMVEKAGNFILKGLVKDNKEAEAKIIVTNDSELINPKMNIDKTVKKIDTKYIDLLPESDFFHQQEKFLQFLLYVDDDRMLYNFREAAGLSTKGATPMTGWDDPECNLKGHTTGHYLSGLALSYSSTGNKKIKEKINYMVEQLHLCQEEMSKHPDKYNPGFLSGYDESQFDLLEKFTTYPTIWAPYYTLHKIMAGLKDCYIEAGNELALKILKKIGLWVYNRLSKLSKTHRDKMWSMYIAGEFGGINENLADLYILTKDKRYLTASKYFDNDKLYLPMKIKIDALGNLHANQHIPQIIGCLKQFEADSDKERFEIADTFWNFVTKDHIYSIGGTGETEMFKPPKQIAKFISEKTAESCASYNMVKLSGRLYEYKNESKYMDYYEKTLYNHILSCGDSSEATGGSTYFMPTNPGAHKKFDTSENTCCHGTGLENHFKYGEYIYTETDDDLIINLSIPSKLTYKDADIELSTDIGSKNFDVKVKINRIDKKILKLENLSGQMR